MSKAKAKQAQQKRTQAAEEMRKQVAEIAKTTLPQLQKDLEEVADDNMSLLSAVKGLREGQASLKSGVARELARLSDELASASLYRTLIGYCRDLAPVQNAIERMLDSADFSDGDTTRKHVESFALTLRSVLERMGFEQMAIVVGEDAFDSKVHDCVRTCSEEDTPFPEAAPGTVVKVEENGYTLTGKTVLPARVWVQAWREGAVSNETKGAE